MIHPEAESFVGARADAYAGDLAGLASALAYLATPAEPVQGLHLRFLGGLGTEAAHGTAVGTTLRLADRISIGRSPDCDLVLRQGPHSDQNIVAWRHALIVSREGRALVSDLGSTNGTFVRGRRIDDDTSVAAGDLIAIAACFRVVLLG